MDSYVTATEARQRFVQLLDEVESGDQIIVTRRGTPVAVLIDFEKLETLKSLTRLWQDPESLRAMKESLDAAKAGRMLKMKGRPAIAAILKTTRAQGFVRG
jgi:prevent-host-death family protein